MCRTRRGLLVVPGVQHVAIGLIAAATENPATASAKNVRWDRIVRPKLLEDNLTEVCEICIIVWIVAPENPHAAAFQTPRPKKVHRQRVGYHRQSIERD